MKNVIIYGKGEYYKKHKDELPADMKVVAYADSSAEAATSVTGRLYEGKPVLNLRNWRGRSLTEYVYVRTT